MTFLRQLAGTTGKLIDSIPGGNKTGSLFGNKFIDVSATLENYGGNQSGSLASAVVRPTPQVLAATNEQNQSTQQIGPKYDPSLASSTSFGAGGAPVNNPAPQPVNNPQPQGDQGPSTIDIIEQNFRNEQGLLNQFENTARTGAAQQQNLLQSEAAQAKETIGERRGLQQQELQGRETQVRQDAQQGTARIKQMLSDLQNQNLAFLASRGGGAFESSLGQALGERLGRTAAQEVGGLETQKLQSLGEIQQEAQRTERFFDEKLIEIDQDLTRGMQTIEQELQARLDQIAGARGESQKAKSQATLDAWQNYASQRQALNLQAFNAQQAMSQWAMEKGQTLAQAQQFALNATQGINPGNFGIVRPDQSLSSGGLANPLAQFNQNSGTRVNVRQGQGQDDENDPLAGAVLPSTVAFS